jgi:hypothetical protein
MSRRRGYAHEFGTACKEDSSVGLATMANTQDAHLPVPVVYFVHHAVVAHPHPPVPVRPGQLAATGRSGIVGENPQRSDHAPKHDGIEVP